jgi:hypothetical protein
MEEAENDLKEMGIRGWRKTAKESDARKLFLKEAKVLRGLRSQCRRRSTQKYCSDK